ncbi:type II toxin-antitoxin system HicA family toxin [Sandaracinus amylolyticus]|uniref:type II toxin-antitoxin system HicA family toxin n=1 Tax=Sandaracinus amylolyticus TaxID=927083 RepID=UPI00196A1C69|nr:type II toxin-antitoxin system HicA family toxin [Sandaracinus amylolyticus]
MKASEVERILKSRGATMARQKGSHRVWKIGTCTVVVPSHKGEDIKVGTLHAIEKTMEPCLGKGWLRGA